MNPYLITTILFTIVIILEKLRSKNKSKKKLVKNEIEEKNLLVENKKTPKYVYVGLGTIIRVLVECFLYTRKKSKCKDTLFNKVYEEFGSPTSTTHNVQILILKLINKIMVYPKDYKAVKAILCNDICSDRMPKRLTEYFFGGPGRGILFNSGEEAKELRRYTMKTLGHLGFGKNHKMSEIIYEQLTDLLANFENLITSTKNKIQVNNLFTHSAINIVWCIIGGEKFAQNDKTLLFLYENVERMANFDLAIVPMAMILPKWFLLFLDHFGFQHQKFLTSIQDLAKFFRNYIEEKKLRLSATDPIDFVDCFLLEIEKYRSDHNLNKIYCEEHMSYVLLDLFAAGMDTTSKYMEIAFMFMVANPDIQIKIQNEIGTVIGDGPPSFTTHMKRMPFTQATIMEIHRMGNIIPSMPRLTTKDWDDDDQHFKKDTWIITNFYFFRMDDVYWGDPKTFRPERFLDSENNLILDKLNHVLPFGAGSRVCLGERVASAAIFVFLTGILQRYTVIQNDPNEFLGLTKSFVAVSHPEPFYVTLIPRSV